MPKHRLLVLTLLLLASTHAQGSATEKPWLDPTLSPEKRADLLVKAMTQEEKLRVIRSDAGDAHEDRHLAQPAGSLGAAGYVPAMPRLGLPAIQLTDAGLGVRSIGLTGKSGTALPAGLAIAASFDPQVAFAGGAMIGRQARANGFNVLLAGGNDLVRDPRNGRNFEYAGEDPLLAGTIAGNAVKGVQSAHIVSTMKHYVLNALESGRNTLSADIDKDALRESDLLAFQIGIEIGKPLSIMCSYNRLNTVYTCEDPWVLNTVLKEDWGYPGFVMSDWGAVHSPAAAGAGLDQESASNVFDDETYFDQPLRKALTEGTVSQARVDDMARRVVYAYFASGVVDDPVPTTKPGAIDYVADARVSQTAAEEGAVLLRNQHDLLPLSTSLQHVAVIGGHADEGVLVGGGSSQVGSPERPTVSLPADPHLPGRPLLQPSSPLAAINRLTGGKARFANGTDVAAAAALAKQSDVAVVFVTQWTAEGYDPPSMALAGNQDQLVSAVARANPRTIVVVQNNGPVRMPWLDQVGAVLDIWYAGARGGDVVANLLFGKVDPGGRLPVTWPVDESQLPRPVIEGAGWPTGEPADHVDYTIEGSDVGYRWFEKKNLKPLFPFGFGLTYTHFDYGKVTVAQQGGDVVVAVDVTNSGKRAGADVPQVYVTLPGDKVPRRLAGFSRITLAPGEHRTVTIRLEPRILARYHDGWQRAGGNYVFAVGRSASDMAGQGTLTLPEWHEPPKRVSQSAMVSQRRGECPWSPRRP